MSELQEAEMLPRPAAISTAQLGGPAAGALLCALADLAGEDAVVLNFGSGPAARGIFILREGDAVVAYLNECPHFNIPLNLRSNNFRNITGKRLLCVHHCARFRILDGYCDAGPCEGHWLTPVAIEVRAGRVFAAGVTTRLTAPASTPAA